MTGSWKDVLNDTSTLERYKSVFHERNEELGAFIETRIDPPLRESADTGTDTGTGTGEAGGTVSKRPLESIPVAVKDNIAVEGFRLTCGSKLLEHYACPYDATAVARLRDAGAFIPGKTALDEFGMGSATDTSSFVDCRNPWDRSRTAGGSSGGSAAAVAAGMVPAALGSDTGGSIRQPAGFCGVYGLKPTYGAVSRYGLVAYASSLDTVGVLADNPQRLADVFSAVGATDERDQTSASAAGASEAARNGVEGQRAGSGPHDGAGDAGTLEVLDSMEGLRIGVLEGDLGLAPGVEKVYRGTIERLAQHGGEIVTINLKSLEYAAAVYYTIAVAEASANLARFDGVRYGARPDYAENPEELTRRARSQGLGDEVKLRILLGTFVLRSGFHDQYYRRAQRLRAHISRELRETFEACSAILAPIFPTVAFPLGSGGPDGLARKQADRFTSLANLAGLPALAFPAGVAHPDAAGAGDQTGAGDAAGELSSAGALPVGLQLLGPAWSEERLLSIAAALHAEQQPATPPDYPRVWS